MKEATRFIETLGAILDLPAGSGLETPPADTLIAAARADVETLHMADPSAPFELGDGAVRWRGRPVPGTASWPWTERLVDAGISRLAPPDGEEAFRAWLAGLRKRVGHAPDGPATASTRDPASGGDPSAASDPSGVSGPGTAPDPGSGSAADIASDPAQGEDAASDAGAGAPAPGGRDGLEEEEERIWSLYSGAARLGRVTASEAEALAERLADLPAATYTARSRVLDPFGELTTVHALNVALLSIGLARHLAFDEDETRMVGLAAVLHDVGRVRLIGADQATTPDQQRTVVRQHPAIGARLLLDSDAGLALPAVVAYEHHLGWRRAGGYPPLRYARSPHPFSRIVAICDTFDALRTERTYRPALTKEGAVEYLHVLGGKSLDPEVVTGFIGYSSEPYAWIPHPSTRPAAPLAELRWLPDSGFDPDLEPRPVRI